MKTVIAFLLVLACSAAVSAQVAKFWVLDNGTRIAGPYDDYYSCSKMMDILQRQTRDTLVCMVQ